MIELAGVVMVVLGAVGAVVAGVGIGGHYVTSKLTLKGGVFSLDKPIVVPRDRVEPIPSESNSVPSMLASGAESAIPRVGSG